MKGAFNLLSKRRWLLAGIAVGAGGWFFVSGWIQPLREMEQANQRGIADLSGQLETARNAIGELGAINQRAQETRSSLARLSMERRAEPTVVWFPEALKAHLRQFGIEGARIRLNSSVEDPEHAEFKRTYWNVQLPPQDGVQDINAVLLAVASIEDQEKSVRILDCSFISAPDDPHRPAGGFNIGAIVVE